MTARRTWIDRVSDGLFNVSFDRMLRDLIMAYRKRKRMTATAAACIVAPAPVWPLRDWEKP